MGLELIPEELKSIPNWVCWAEGKIPIDPKTGNTARSNDDTTWGTYVQAMLQMRKYKGLGFVFNGGLVAIDLDDCVVDGVINDYARSVMEACPSYAEFSPSGTGIHIICKGELAKSYKKAELEIYNSLRYFTMTGDQIPGSLCDIHRVDVEPLVKKEFGEIRKIHLGRERDWVAKAIADMKPGMICETELRVAGKMHRDGWGAGDIVSILEPHVRAVGGDLEALRSRVASVKGYPVSRKFEQPEIKLENMTDFLVSGPTKIDWLVPDLIPKESIGFMAGLGSTNKTWMMMDLAIEHARGGGFWMENFAMPGGNVLYIDQERSKVEARRRFTQLIAGKKLDPEKLRETFHLLVRTSYKINEERSFEDLRRKVDEVRPSLICVDSFSQFHNLNENSDGDLSLIFSQAKKLCAEFGCTFMFLDHERKGILNLMEKDKEPDGHDTKGGTNKFNVSEWFFNVRKEGDKNSMVHHTKATCDVKRPPFLVTVEGLAKDGKTFVKAH